MTTRAGHDVRQAATPDRAHVAGVLAQAFADDPVLLHLLPRTMRRREQRLTLLFFGEFPRSAALRGAWTTGAGDGAAIWYPPGAWRPSSWEELRQAPSALRAFGHRSLVGSRTLATMHGHHPQQPHWYLLYVGVTPARQGNGIGSALMQPVLDRCDQERLPAYLEATCEQNRALYRRHGFTDRDQLPLPNGGPPLYPMWRDPR